MCRGVVLLFLCFSFELLAADSSCGQFKDEGYKKTLMLCDQNHVLIAKKGYFKKTGTLSSVHRYKNKKLVLKQSFNIEGDLVQEFHFEYPEEGSYFKVTYKQDVSPKVEVARSLFKGDPEFGDRLLLADWHYKKEEVGPYTLEAIDYYAEGLIVKREVFSPNEQKEIYVYEHPKLASKFKYVDSFKAYNQQGEVIKEYSPNQSIDVRTYVKDLDHFKVLINPKRRKIAVIDTGFDVSHSELAYKFNLNFKDPIDGVDNDANGIVDDLLGWSVDDEGRFSNNINERVSVKSGDTLYKPFSHGTHVSSIALSEIEEFSLTAFGGNMSQVEHIHKISDLLKKEKVEFVNMSFSFGDYKNPMAPGRPSFRALQEMLKVNSSVLFTVAAGNSGNNLDGGGLAVKEYPASFDNFNILSVGALNTGSLRESQMPEYRPASFSAYGIKSVDVFAPGQEVDGAAVGGGRLKVSGTSMASPFALNVILKIAAKYSDLSPRQLKNIILYSAYIPNLESPFDCVSGGMLFPRRAFELARRLAENGGEIRQLALQLHSEEDYLLKGERQDEIYLKALADFWLERGL